MDILDIVNSFDIPNQALNYYPFGNGHINSTYLVYTKGGNRYVLQKINDRIFTDVQLLMNNVYRVTEYLRKNNFETLRAIKTKNGELYFKDEESYYRLYDYIEDTVCFEKVSNNMFLVYCDGKAFGKLHKALANFDASKLGEVIPHFHDTAHRYSAFLESVKNNTNGRKDTCLEEIEIVNSFKNEYSKIVDGIASHEISFSVTHNDPKINNVLFDKFSGEIRAVIDLDTIMPGSYLYDVGDSFRSLFTGDNEDSEDLSKLRVNYDVFEAFIKGYLSEMSGVLTPKEIELLPFSGFLMTIECGMRFLKDYLDGDIYFKTKYKTHNLVRARTQLTLAQDIYNNLDKLSNIIKKVNKNIDNLISIGIDIGGTSIKGASVNAKGQILDSFKMDVVKGEPQETTVKKIINLVNDFINSHKYKNEEIVGVGCGVPGIIDSTNGIVTFSGNLNWHDLPLMELLEEGIGLPVKITNDANAAALAEAKFGSGDKYKSFLMITLGTGIGSGIFVDGKLYEGNLGKGAEFGHSLLVMDGRECVCGRKGCLEAYASATALKKDAQDMMIKHQDSLMWKLYVENHEMNAKIPFKAARMGDVYAQEVIDNYVKYLSEGLLNYFNIFRPEAVILSGGIAEEGEYLISKIRKYCEDRNYGLKMSPKVDIVKSKVGYDSGKIGAAALFMDK